MFIFSTFHFWWLALASGILALATILIWLWTGTAPIPEKEEKDVGLGLKLPLYLSGPRSVGWWAMFITMMGDMTAFISLIFGYFFYWTLREDFPPDSPSGPGISWPILGALLLLGCWGLTVLARRWNAHNRTSAFYGALLGASALGVGGGATLIAAPWVSGLNPTRHVYPAIVWLLVLWTVLTWR